MAGQKSVPRVVSTLRTQRAEKGHTFTAVFHFGFIWEYDRLHLCFEQENGRPVGITKMPVTLKFKKIYEKFHVWNENLIDPLNRSDIGNLMFHYADGVDADGKPEYFADKDQMEKNQQDWNLRAYLEFARRHPEIPGGETGREIWNALRFSHQDGVLTKECGLILAMTRPPLKLITQRNCEVLSEILGISEKEAAALPKGLHRNYLIEKYILPSLPKRWTVVQDIWDWLKEKRAKYALTPIPNMFPLNVLTDPGPEQKALWQTEQICDGAVSASPMEGWGEEETEYGNTRFFIRRTSLKWLDAPDLSESQIALRDTVAALENGSYAELMLERLRDMEPEWAEKMETAENQTPAFGI